MRIFKALLPSAGGIVHQEDNHFHRFDLMLRVVLFPQKFIDV